MSTITQAEVAEYISAARVVQITRICQLVPCVVMFYDHILAFDQEVEHIWKSSRSLNTVAYLILRYGGSAAGLLNVFAFLAEEHASNDVFQMLVSSIIDLATALMYNAVPVPQVFLVLRGWSACLMLWLVQFILQMRLYALHNNSKKILLLNGGAYIAEIVVMSTALGLEDVNFDVLNLSRAFYSIWLPPLIFESILCLLAIRIGIQRSKDHFRPALISGTRLVNVIVMGNVMYFVMVLVSCIVNVAMWQNLGPEWLQVPEGFPLAVEVIAGCRLILHIRSAASGGPNDTMSSSTRVGVRLQRFLPRSDMDEA
ncbi:hypothetical protein HYDPIDRAFT_33957 [Hydnomerulius pinastri MD-312]|uniref:DUF6533 domain-containing protein n=1 Tax=Hydnomerulius pinastri MD-312 TaxID=994086 RepID=A0A0C9VM15_9AGAM|nr:hypothetical protein HYDPIDRAFT_33957 [Hydnomerulius pinastri MD-312]